MSLRTIAIKVFIDDYQFFYSSLLMEEQKNPAWKAALREAIDIVGGQVALASKTGTSQPRIWYLLHNAERFPSELAPKIEAATDGQVPAWRFLPAGFSVPGQAA